ncbi:uncharacterized protein [Glycine max]|uniref:uncharacterized protein n=1 Tax=Glycine max TaxID=3847 RepID=UPI0007192438|nr:uncharacterized protein LOC100806934 [Glycine max]|eukprot:XP_014624023.1 uncharacterized protein LOC100806934 isoform X3 [Glycine max]
MGWPFSRIGASGFSSYSTAKEVTHGIDGSGLTAIVTGICAAPFALSKDNIELQFAINYIVTTIGVHMDNQSLLIFCMPMNWQGVSRFSQNCKAIWRREDTGTYGEKCAARSINNMLCSLAPPSEWNQRQTFC